MNDDHVVVLCTVPEEETGEKLAEALVSERLAACVNMLPGVRSFYRWQGELCDEGESLLVIKTRRDAFDALRARIVELHPYDVPEIIAMPVVAGHHPYLAWIDQNVGAKHPS